MNIVYYFRVGDTVITRTRECEIPHWTVGKVIAIDPNKGIHVEFKDNNKTRWMNPYNLKLNNNIKEE